MKEIFENLDELIEKLQTIRKELERIAELTEKRPTIM